MMLKVGIRLNADLNHTGHGSKLLHLSKLKAVRFSYPSISKGLSCLMDRVIPLKTFFQLTSSYSMWKIFTYVYC
jgi:hypothetical protein